MKPTKIKVNDISIDAQYAGFRKMGDYIVDSMLKSIDMQMREIITLALERKGVKVEDEHHLNFILLNHCVVKDDKITETKTYYYKNDPFLQHEYNLCFNIGESIMSGEASNIELSYGAFKLL